MQPIPSARPNAPSPSARVALTETGAPRTSIRRDSMAPAWGAIRGRSVTTVQSAFISRNRLCAINLETSPSKSMESAPAQRGSVSGKCRPRSPSPAAPNIESATAWATTSASLCPTRPGLPGIVMPPNTNGRSGSSENRWMSMPWPIRNVPGSKAANGDSLTDPPGLRRPRDRLGP